MKTNRYGALSRLVAVLLIFSTVGCSALSFGSRARYGQRSATGYVTGQAANALCIVDLDGEYRRLRVAERKVADLARAELIGRQVAIWAQDGLVVDWDRDGQDFPLRQLPLINLDTCAPLQDQPGALVAAAVGSCPPVVEACTILGAALKDMERSGGRNHHPEVGTAVELLCTEKSP